MSCAMTIDAVRDRRKTVTRRHADTWRTLAPGDRLTLVEKAQGLKRGERQIVLAEVEVLSNRTVGLLESLSPDEIRREGFDPNEWSPLEWAKWWAASHRLDPWHLHGVECRRIEWHYLDEDPS
jgi:hypothetical protein